MVSTRPKRGPVRESAASTSRRGESSTVVTGVSGKRGGAGTADPRASRLQVDERRAQLLALGAELFNRKPYDEIAIEDIAAAAGISKGLLYHYFPSKKAFYVETIRAGTTEIATLTDEPDDGRPPLQRLRAGLEKYLAFVEARPRAYVHVLRSGVGFDPEVGKMIEKTRRAMAKRILDGLGLAQPSPALALAVHGWVGFVEATTLLWIENPRAVDRTALADLLARMVEATVLTATATTEPKSSDAAPDAAGDEDASHGVKTPRKTKR
jgi:AcrR family transcriptional regulator